MMSEEHCLYCRVIIPKGRQVCPLCEEKLNKLRQTNSVHKTIKKIKEMKKWKKM